MWNYEMGYGHNLNLLIISYELHVSYPMRSGWREGSIQITHVYLGVSLLVFKDVTQDGLGVDTYPSWYTAERKIPANLGPLVL